MKLKSELIFPGKLKDEPIICSLCKKFDITVKILEASFATQTGWAILILTGKKDELSNAFDYLTEKGVTFERVKKIS